LFALTPDQPDVNPDIGQQAFQPARPALLTATEIAWLLGKRQVSKQPEATYERK
jgi:hypothetical protein